MVIRVSAPGKIILFGEHAVVYGYPAIALSIGLRCFIDVKPATESSVSAFKKLYVTFRDLSKHVIELDWTIINEFIVNPGDFSLCRDYAKNILEEKELTDLKDLSLEKSLAAFIYLMVRSLKPNPSLHEAKHTSLNVCVHSEIPLNVGLGSSAAFVVAAATTCLILNGALSVSPNQKLSSFQLDVIKNLASESENIFHVKSSGLDPFISTKGGCVCFQNISGKLTYEDLECPANLTPRLLIVNTNITRSTSAIVDDVAKRRKKETKKYDDILMNIGELTTEAKTHLISDIGDSDLQFLSPLIQRNQLLLTDLGVSHPKLDALMLELNQIGVTSKITGAGCGGCILGYPVPSNWFDADNMFSRARTLGELCGLNLHFMLVTSFTEGVSVSST